MSFITVSGADTVAEHIHSFVDGFDDKLNEIAYNLCDKGALTAVSVYAGAEYTGTPPDPDLEINKTNTGYELTATGDGLGFMEFGTGVIAPPYPISVPQVPERGSYGKHRGLNPPWYYVGEPGTGGTIVARTKSGEDVVRTFGVSPASGMYTALQEMNDSIYDVASEVFENG